MAGPPGPLLSAPREDGIRAPRHGVDRLRGDGGLRRGRALWTQSAACGPGGGFRRRQRDTRRHSGLGRREMGSLPRRREQGVTPRGLLVLCHDALAAALAWMLAFWLRFNLDVPPEYSALMTHEAPWVAAICGVIFWRLGLYRGLWRFASLPDFQRIAASVAIAALAVPAVLSFLELVLPVPRSVYLLTPVLLVLMMSSSRLAYRAWREGHLMPALSKPGATPVLVLGSGTAAAALLKDLSPNPRWRVVGLLDDDAAKRGGALLGIKILGGVSDIGRIAERLGVTDAIIAMPGATHGERKRAVDLCNASGISAMTVPALTDIVSGKVSVSELRPIELDDLLGRDPVQLDTAGLHGLLAGRTILVTGAGG